MDNRTVDCRKFLPNIFNKSKCSHCFRQREEHCAAALESNRASRKVSKCGYLFVAPDWDFSNPLYRTKRWQRRWFVLYDDGELTYSVDEHPETIPQACVDMTKVLEVTSAENVTGHTNSLAITAPDRVTFVKGTCPEEAKWWLNVLSAFPKNKGRHKRNATFPGGQATTIISTQNHPTSRNRHNSYHPNTGSVQCSLNGNSIEDWDTQLPDENDKNVNNGTISNRVYIEHPVTSNSPPTRDKINPEIKSQSRARNRNRNSSNGTQQQISIDIVDAPCQSKENIQKDFKSKEQKIISPLNLDGKINEKKIQNRIIATTSTNQISSSTPSIVSAIVKKNATNVIEIFDNSHKNIPEKDNNQNISNNVKQTVERGDPDGGCNIDDINVNNYISNKNSEVKVNLKTTEDNTNTKKGWLMKQDTRTMEWSRHWFTLRGAALFYYRDPVAEERGVLDGVLDVNGLTGICEINLPQYYGFQLKTWDNRKIILSTMSSSSRNNWVNLLKSIAGLAQIDKIIDDKNTKNNEKPKLIINNSTDDLKICEKINKNVSNVLKSPTAPQLTSKSILFSSDEEYKTASESGRRDSIDWGSPISTSPTISFNVTSSNRTKDRIRSRSNSSSRNYKRPKSTPPTSRRSTTDSMDSDEIILIPPVNEENKNLNNDKMEVRLTSAEKELHFLKEEVQNRENRVSNLLTTLEKTESDLTKRILDVEKVRDNLAIQLNENKYQAQEYINQMTVELETNKKIIQDLEDKLAHGIVENENLYKKIRELENSSPLSVCSLNQTKIKHFDSLSDLTALNDIDPFTLTRDRLADEYNELKLRYEKAINEIKLMKKELREAQSQFDNLEITHSALRKDFERVKMEDDAQFQMMAARIQDLTLKYSAAERQVRNLKAKLTKSTEKRRSLSLKGRESFSLPKDLEDKVIELESKIDAIEKTKQDDHHPLKKSSTRLRRKSLDNSAISSEPLQILLRVNNLEKKVNSQTNSRSSSVNNFSDYDCKDNSNNDNDNNNDSVNNKNSSPKLTEHLILRLKSLESVVIAAREKVELGLRQLQNTQSTSYHHRNRRSMSPISDKKDPTRKLEKYLQEAGKILRDTCENCIMLDQHNPILIADDNNPIKLALTQLEAQLRTKLSELLKRRRVLKERNELSTSKDLEFLAERIAYESVYFGKLRDSVERAESSIKLDNQQKKIEITETSQLLSLLKLKLSGKYSIKPSGSLDILASVLARRLFYTASIKLPEQGLKPIGPINSSVIDELQRQQNELNLIFLRYKNNAMDNLASVMAAETLSYISASDTVQGAIQEAWRQAQETVNSELVQNEIAQIMTKNVERFESLITPTVAFALTSSERINFETFSDIVQEELKKGMGSTITQLTKKYEECLSKIKNGQWKSHLEQDHKPGEGRQLLFEFADMIAHKSMVDARINILKGEYNNNLLNKSLPTEDNGNNTNNYFNAKSIQKYETLFIELAEDLDINNPGDIIAEADYNFMFKHFYNDFKFSNSELKPITNSLLQLEQSVKELESFMNQNSIKIDENNSNESSLNLSERYQNLTKKIEQIVINLKSTKCERCEDMKKLVNDLKSTHQIELKNYENSYKEKLDNLNIQLMDKSEVIDFLQTEKSNILCEIEKNKNLIKSQDNQLNEINDKLKDVEMSFNEKLNEVKDLNERISDEQKNTENYKIQFDELSKKYEIISTEYTNLLQEHKKVSENLDRERERGKKLEKHLEFLENEHQYQIEQIHENLKLQIFNVEDFENRFEDEETLRARYQGEIEQLRTLCEKGLAAIETSHRQIIRDLEEKHRQEIQNLLMEKERALAEETQATLAALDAMRKAHENEVQREIARFKEEFIKQFQLDGSSGHRDKELELEDVRLEILSLSEKYSYKCVEAASLDEKLKAATQQIKHSQQIIKQLELRNKQLRAHLIADDMDLSSLNSISSSKESIPMPGENHEDHITKTSIVGNENIYATEKKEMHSRMNTVEGVSPTTLAYRPVYNPSSLLTSSSNTDTKNCITNISNLNTSSLHSNIKYIAPKNLNMKLSMENKNRNFIKLTKSLKQTNQNNLIQHEQQQENVNDEGGFLKSSTTQKLLCSPPSLSAKDVEHLRKFELEI